MLDDQRAEIIRFGESIRKSATYKHPDISNSDKSTALSKAEQDFNNLMQKAFYEFPSDDFEELVSYILATLVLNYET